jgi:nucleotide-binding universal stress UspA family protein
MNRVLIALDYDPTAQIVAESGYSLAKSMNAEVLLLHVISDPVYYSSIEYSPIMGFNGYLDMGQAQSIGIERLKEASLQYLEKSKQHLGDKAIRTMIKEGDFADAILETAIEEHADIIVLGSHSRRWLEEVLLGSVTEKVLHYSSVPLFVIPTKKHN